MATFAVILITLLTFIAPIVAVLLIIDKDKKAVIPLLIGGGLFTVVEACIILPVINYLGYNAFYNIIGIIIIEVLRWLVLGLYLKKAGYDADRIKYFFAGYVIVNLFVVWGIDALATATVVMFSDFGILEPGEIWLSMLLAVIKAVMVYSYTVFAAVAIRQKKIRYMAAAIGIHVISDTNIIIELCEVININPVVIGATWLLIVACIMLVVNDKMSELWKGKNHED